jgi:hypothetical protein
MSTVNETSVINASNVIPNVPSTNTPYRISRFTLPQFEIKTDVETWFSVSDQIFAAQNINTEAERFGFFLQSLSHQDISYIKDIITSDSGEKYSYTESKQRLISVYGQSQTEKIRRFLQGTNINKNQ